LAIGRRPAREPAPTAAGPAAEELPQSRGWGAPGSRLRVCRAPPDPYDHVPLEGGHRVGLPPAGLRELVPGLSFAETGSGWHGPLPAIVAAPQLRPGGRHGGPRYHKKRGAVRREIRPIHPAKALNKELHGTGSPTLVGLLIFPGEPARRPGFPESLRGLSGPGGVPDHDRRQPLNRVLWGAPFPPMDIQDDGVRRARKAAPRPPISPIYCPAVPEPRGGRRHHPADPHFAGQPRRLPFCRTRCASIWPITWWSLPTWAAFREDPAKLMCALPDEGVPRPRLRGDVWYAAAVGPSLDST